MSYYMMGIKFWTEVSVLMGMLPLLAASSNGVARVLARALRTDQSPLAAGVASKRSGLLDVCGAPSTR